MTLRDIFNICEVKKQPVIKIQTDTSDPSDSKKAKKTAKKKQKLVNISHNICSKLQINTNINND